MAIFLWAHFGKIGGGQTKSGALLRLWRRRKLNVSIIHWGPIGPSEGAQLKELGCPVHCIAHESELARIPELRGALVIGICNDWFLRSSDSLRELNCQLVWDNLMTEIGATEGILYENSLPFDGYVFESPYQQRTLIVELQRIAVQPPRTFLIREPLEITDFEFAPRPASLEQDFVIGQLARPDIAKWSRRMWEIYGLVDHPHRKALVMGVDDMIRGWLRIPPEWATVLPPGAISAQEFYRQLHCLVPLNFSAVENWPRIGLEAMACGVPIVALKQGGWCDMIEHGRTGFLAADWREVVAMTTALARDEQLRQQIIATARERLQAELANPDLIWAGWEQLFHQLA